LWSYLREVLLGVCFLDEKGIYEGFRILGWFGSMAGVSCVGSDAVCSEWVPRVEGYLRGLRGLVGDVPGEVLLVAGEGGVVFGGSGGECLTCSYDVVVPVRGGVGRVEGRVSVFLALASYYVRRVLAGVGSCPMPFAEGLAYYLAFLASRSLDEEVHDYLAGLLGSVSVEDALKVLAEYGDLIVDSGYRVVLRSGEVGDVAEALREVVGKSVRLKEDVRACAAMGKYVMMVFEDAGVGGEGGGTLKEVLEAAPKVLSPICRQ